MNSVVDIVVTWVDGNDPKWLECKKKYDSNKIINASNGDARFRDFDLMRYWFRGIEKNMPWVNKVFFVTWGHFPKWLDVNNEKLVIVKHTEFIPKQYLPTFNSNVIELNLHRIKGLSENFLLFNDDFFVIDRVEEKLFFKNGLPCDCLLLKTLVNYDRNSYVWHMVFNDMGMINKYFSGRKAAFMFLAKWINPCYGFKNIANNLMRMTGKRISSFYDSHFIVPHRKSVFEKIWNLEGDYLNEVCMNKFRTPLDLNHWLMRYWNFASGEFEPIDNGKFSHYFEFGESNDDVDKMCKAIKLKEKAVIVINDTISKSKEYMVEEYKRKLKNAFEEILPEKSSFEKW